MLRFWTDGIDINIPDNRDIGTLNNVTIAIELRGCKEGEELTPDGKCQECRPGYYLLVAPDKT